MPRLVADRAVGSGDAKAPNNQLSDGLDHNDKPFLPAFPYLATPHEGFRYQG